MKASAWAVAGIVALSASLAAQSNEDKYKEKLEKEFVSKITWVRTLGEAQAKAAAEKKLIYGYFTRSYAP